jgi:hypothetical protein
MACRGKASHGSAGGRAAQGAGAPCSWPRATQAPPPPARPRASRGPCRRAAGALRPGGDLCAPPTGLKACQTRPRPSSPGLRPCGRPEPPHTGRASAGALPRWPSAVGAPPRWMPGGGTEASKGRRGGWGTRAPSPGGPWGPTSVAGARPPVAGHDRPAGHRVASPAFPPRGGARMRGPSPPSRRT